MSIQSQLEEADRSLVAARAQAMNVPDAKLANAIGTLLKDLRGALADPGDAWLDDTEGAWRDFPKEARYDLRFAASIAAGELRKFAKQYSLTRRGKNILFGQIAELEAIAKGGGE